MRIAIFAMTLMVAGPVQSGPAPRTIFSCILDNNRTVRVTAAGRRLTYSYGMPRRAELTIVGSARAGNVYWMTQRYAGLQYQLRFARGAYSYVLFSMDANAMSQSSDVSGLVVMRRTARVSHGSCKKHERFRWSSSRGLPVGLPEDDEAFSAM